MKAEGECHDDPPTTISSLGRAHSPAIDAARRVTALALAGAGAALGRLADRIQPRAASSDGVAARLEFHCQAGAPEGALFLDGRLIARIPGVKRL